MPYRILLGIIFLALLASKSPAADVPSWTDAKGNTFKGEPIEVLGGMATFQQGHTAGKVVPLTSLPPAECVRYFQAVAQRPVRSARWSEATGRISRELIGRILTTKHGKLVAADLSGRPEPAVFVILYSSGRDAMGREGSNSRMLHNFLPTFRRLKAVYGDDIEGVFFGGRGRTQEQGALGQRIGEFMLVADHGKKHEMDNLAAYAPGTGNVLVAISRDGAPLLAAPATEVLEVKRFADRLSFLLRLTGSSGYASALERYHYAMATRPVQFASGSDAPVLIYDPLVDSALRRYAITQVTATFDVDAAGVATAVSVGPELAVSPDLQARLVQSMQRGFRFCPAIKEGVAVPGTYTYVKHVPAHDPLSPPERAWIENPHVPEIPIASWLVLRPIQVTEADIAGTTTVDEFGVVQLSKFQVLDKGVSKTAQTSAFSHNWFDELGADSVRPNPGDTQVINETKLVWTKLKSEDGFVDLRSERNRDFCVGYATTVIRSDRDTNALLGLGSDDGVKIWCNGELVKDAWVRRISRLDEDIVPVKLRAGENRLLIKIQNMRGEWSFICRLRPLPQ